MPDDFSDFDTFARLLEKIAPRRPFQGIRYRQGESPVDFGDPGRRKYTDVNAYMQVGAHEWTGAGVASGGFTIALPAAYAGSALVYVTPVATTPLAIPVHLQAWCDGSSIEVLWATNGDEISRLWLHWLTLGSGSI